MTTTTTYTLDKHTHTHRDITKIHSGIHDIEDILFLLNK